ncbi:MAG: hypothetical protein ACRDH7_07980 [Actinomycetota bacterium]
MTASPPELFCDRSLGGRIVPDALRRAAGSDVSVIAHDDRFAQDTDDAVWLADRGRRGSIVLTKDERIRRRSGETNVIVAAGVRCFCLHPSRDLTGKQMGEVLVRALPRILVIAAAQVGGYVKTIDRSGRIRHLFP